MMMIQNYSRRTVQISHRLDKFATPYMHKHLDRNCVDSFCKTGFQRVILGTYSLTTAIAVTHLHGSIFVQFSREKISLQKSQSTSNR